MRHLLELAGDDLGQDLIEYGLLAAFISVVATAAIVGLGLGINDFYENRIVSQLP